MTTPPLTHDATNGTGASELPAVIVFDVNETLSDMSPMADR
ncbi:MAG: haloacid dehalogenase type II, partial [Cellulomonas sp.]|nr:haloacid dehalogenase type II [Cellulomonas sp.]